MKAAGGPCSTARSWRTPTQRAPLSRPSMGDGALDDTDEEVCWGPADGCSTPVDRRERSLCSGASPAARHQLLHAATCNRPRDTSIHAGLRGVGDLSGPAFGEFSRPSALRVGDPNARSLCAVATALTAAMRPASASPAAAWQRRPRRDHNRPERSGGRRRRHVAAAIVSTQRPAECLAGSARPDGAGCAPSSSLGPNGSASVHASPRLLSNLATSPQRVSATSSPAPIRGRFRTPQGHAGVVERAPRR